MFSETDARRYVGSQRWKYASTMPNNPHEYQLLRVSTDQATHLQMVDWLREGKEELYYGHGPFYYQTIDGQLYWAGPRESRDGPWTIINREKKG